MCHDYQPGGRALAYRTTVGEQRTHNVQINAHTSKQEFIEMRERVDAMLPAPTQILPALQVNINGGVLPAPEDNGVTYLKIPLDVLGRGHAR